MTVAQAKNRFSDVLRRAEYTGERVVVHRRGKPVAAIVSTTDLERLERLEDEEDLRDANAALKQIRKTGGIALKDVLRKHGLEHFLEPRAATGENDTAPSSRRTRVSRRRPVRRGKRS